MSNAFRVNVSLASRIALFHRRGFSRSSRVTQPVEQLRLRCSTTGRKIHKMLRVAPALGQAKAAEGCRSRPVPGSASRPWSETPSEALPVRPSQRSGHRLDRWQDTPAWVEAVPSARRVRQAREEYKRKVLYQRVYAT